MIGLKLKLVAIISLLSVIIAITHFVKKNKITIKYAIIWYLSLIVLMIFTAFPEILGWFTSLIGMKLSSNFLFVLLIAFLFIICISLTIIVSEQKEQIRLLIQEVSILNSERENKNGKKNK